MYQELRPYLLGPELRTYPRVEFRIGKTSRRMPSPTPATATSGASSKLLRAYLAIGAKICGPPAIDRAFGTIDFLTLLDLYTLPAIVRAHFLR